MGKPILYDEFGASDYLKVNVLTLRYWRYAGNGPKFIKQGRRVCYDEADLDAWLEACRVQSTSEVKKAS